MKVAFEAQMIKWSQIELVWAITYAFMHGFQNNLAQLLARLQNLSATTFLFNKVAIADLNHAVGSWFGLGLALGLG